MTQAVQAVSDAHLQRLSEFIANTMGLHYPPERWLDLQRGLTGASAELGFEGPEGLGACADWLLSSASLTPAHLQVLADHLTIGETYFFRGKRTFEALRNTILPALIQTRRGRKREQRLRLWSAACCTGEEAYSLAILLQQILPDPADWHVSILATDINTRFLKKAVAGCYGEWSFREEPEGFRERYFTRGADGRYTIAPEIRKWVTFAPLNLVEDVYPSLSGGTNAMDLIFCRNVLMYFTPAQACKAIGNLYRTLVPEGWLAVSPSETSQAAFPQFATRNFPGVVLYQKSNTPDRGGLFPAAPLAPIPEPAPFFKLAPEWPRVPESAPAPLPETEKPAPEPIQPTAEENAVLLYDQGRYAEAAEVLFSLVARRGHETKTLSLLAHALANQGKLDEALAWCDRWLAVDKLDSAGHYLRAVVLLEQGHPGQARPSLQRAVYLRPDFILAHFAMGNLARNGGKTDEADKHFANALRLLKRLPPQEMPDESDGITAGRLIETLTAMTTLENAR